jgi:DNA adenine methylase
MKPRTMKMQILGASYFLRDKTATASSNYRDILKLAEPKDLVYMDPPYQGVCGNRDTRYLESVQFCEFVEALEELNSRQIRYIVSYDGRTGDKSYGKTLPDELNLTLIELDAGRSSQATLLGRKDVTIESLYLSPALADQLAHVPTLYRYPDSYEHVAMRQIRRADILWSGAEVSVYDKLKERTLELQKHLPAYIKELVEKHLEE